MHLRTPVAVFVFFYASHALALETWRYAKDSAEISGELVSVDAERVTFRKPEGGQFSVEITDLHAKSQSQARFFWYLRADSVKFGYIIPRVTVSNRLAPFPAQPALAEWKDHLIQEVRAGHPEVLWVALPEKLRKEIAQIDLRNPFDGQDPRAQLAAAMRLDSAVDAVHHIGFQLAAVLVNKEEFAKNCYLVKSSPQELRSVLTNDYESIPGLFHELSSLVFALKGKPLEQIDSVIRSRGPRIGSFLRRLLESLPEETVEHWIDTIETLETGPDSGVLVLRFSDKPIEINMIRYEGRWMPQIWHEAALNEWRSVSQPWMPSADTAGSSFNAMLRVGFVGQVFKNTLRVLHEAETQAEFDKAIQR